MARAIRESNVSQAMREVTVGLLTPIASGLALYAHKKTSLSGSSATLFLLAASVLTAVTVKEATWLLKMFLWSYRRKRRKVTINPRIATRADYIWWITLYLIFFIAVTGPLIVFAFSVRVSIASKVPRVSIVLEPLAIAGLVGLLTGELLSAGLIAGVERWGNLTGENFESVPNLVLVILVVPAGFLSILHAGRTLAALAGIDLHYLAFLKSCRWRYDAHSEALTIAGHPGAVLASTARPRMIKLHDDDVPMQKLPF